VEESLYEEGFAFDFFQAVRVLERLDRARRPVGLAGPPRAEVVRFRAHLSLSFPASTIYEVTRPTPQNPLPAMTVAFMGLTGPSGTLPRHYTELLLRLQREAKGPEKNALRDWLDLFNHRLISLFYRAWVKYRFYIPYERGDYDLPEPDAFTRGLLSLIGIEPPSLRRRLRVSTWEDADGESRERVLARIDDLALLHYGGFLAHRPRNAVSLEALLADYFQMPVRVLQFQGQWLVLDQASQSRMGGAGGNNELGLNVVAGDRVWDVQHKVRVRLGPLSYADFQTLLPDRTPVAQRKVFFLLCHLVRFYVGVELDFDVQLVLRAADVPECQLTEGGAVGPRLGWNTWVRSLEFDHDAEDAVFDGEELVFLTPRPPVAVLS
jgi:type VI secretion system protein ImpH